jgi:pimeloyl-ACP methyl ester carboxylesterase
MASFVLVPGAWCGGWAWKWVTPLLRNAGHDVYPLTLTGLGERSHLAHADIDLDTHIQDVINVIEYEDLNDFVLVEWSYGGNVITGVANRIPERIAQLIYLDANRPKHNETLVDEVDPWWQARKQLTNEQGDGWRIPIVTDSWADPTDESGYIPDASIRNWCIERVVPQPIKTFTQPLSVTNPEMAAIPHRHIVCSQGRSEEELAATREAIAQQGGSYRELASHHLCLWVVPEVVATALLDSPQ